MNGHSEKVAFIWSVADVLRGDYKASDFGKVILPFVVLRRLNCVLEATKQAVLDKAKTVKDDIHAYFEREALPHVPDAWINEAKTKKATTFRSLGTYIHTYHPVPSTRLMLT